MSPVAMVRLVDLPETESFGSKYTERRGFRLSSFDRADLLYVFTALEAESGVQSVDARSDEAVEPTLVCERCGSIFRAPRPDPWVPAGGNADDLPARSPIVSARRYCSEECRWGHRSDVVAMHEAWRSPPAPPADAAVAVRSVRGADGVDRLLYGWVQPRRLPPGPEPEESQVIPCKNTRAAGTPGAGGEGSATLYALEAFAGGFGCAMHTRGWTCRRTLSLMQSRGRGRDTAVLARVYSNLAPHAPYEHWKWTAGAGGTRTFDPKEVAPISDLTAAVEERRVALVESRCAAYLAKPDVNRAAMFALEAESIRRRLIMKPPRGVEVFKELRNEMRRLILQAADEEREHRELSSRGIERMRQSIDASTTPREGFEWAIRMLTPGAKKPGEPKMARRERERAIGQERRTFLNLVGRQAERILETSSLEYREARQAVSGA